MSHRWVSYRFRTLVGVGQAIQIVHTMLAAAKLRGHPQ
jgi:hypothetical protein